MEYLTDDDEHTITSLAMPVTREGAAASHRLGNEDEDLSDADDADSPLAEAQVYTQRVGRFRYFVLCLLLTAGLLLSLGVYAIATKTESDPEHAAPINEAAIYDAGTQAAIVGTIFLVVILAFLRYDYLVTRRNTILVDTARRSTRLIDSLFPAAVRDRLLREQQQGTQQRARNDQTSRSLSEADGEIDFATLTKLNTMANKGNGRSQLTESAKLLSGGLTSAANQPMGLVQSYLAKNAGRIPPDSNGDAAHPIADLFNPCTVLFADIAGFTAWSAEREPHQVFMLLETLYNAFDRLGDTLKVFKVETIGDCYLAVTGLPDPDELHAVSMAKFAYQCMLRMEEEASKLESLLGPGTTDLKLRIGIHSGPVTAGVLRGQKSRFQLFGDTVNTASRMESTGMGGKIQVSQETADVLMQHGKNHWLKARDDKVVAKGKGELQTYWLEPSNRRGNIDAKTGAAEHTWSDKDEASQQKLSVSLHEGKGQLGGEIGFKPKRSKVEELSTILVSAKSPLPGKADFVRINGDDGNRKDSARQAPLLNFSGSLEKETFEHLIDWNADIFMQHLAAIAATSPDTTGSRAVQKVDYANESPDLPLIFESVADVILLPDYARANAGFLGPTDLATLRSDVRQYVSEIAHRYNQNACFHNFEHASHVTMAMNKILCRLKTSKTLNAPDLHEVTYGLSSDPLTHFAMVFAALIHDVAHPGVPNAQLVIEQSELALHYKHRSVAEQHSLQIAWRLLMKPEYQHLRSCIYRNNVERKRFRQVLINAVVATDIADRSLLQERARKWERAFGITGNHANDTSTNSTPPLTRQDVHRRATVVLDGIMQLADIAHATQHWRVYRKWNERLFQEMYGLFLQGRSGHGNPAERWIECELGFFDHYVMPLTTRLHRCGVLGSSSSQYMAQAASNRATWAVEGAHEVSAMTTKANEHYQPIKANSVRSNSGKKQLVHDSAITDAPSVPSSHDDCSLAPSELDTCSSTGIDMTSVRFI